MKKRNFLAILLCFVMIFATACGPADPGPDGPGGGGSGGGGYTGNELVLKVWNAGGGVGQGWLLAAIERFEDSNKGRPFDSGKVGIRVESEPSILEPLTYMQDSDFSVFFAEGIDFNNYQKQEALLPITDLVTQTSAYDNKTIESKLSEETKNALKASDGTNYYVLPHYQSYDGIVYNKTLFDYYGFYFAEDTENYETMNPAQSAYGFVKQAKKNDKTIRTVGPNGIRGDYDDGLPSSIEELKRLCNYIKQKNGLAPLACYDAWNDTYEVKLVNALWASLEGYNGTMSQFTFDSKGTQTSIVTNVSDTGVLTTKKIAITKDNAWEVYQQESKYHALDFAEFVFKQSNDNMADGYWDGISNTFVHEELLEGSAAMMVEGSYWMNEAKDAGTFADYPEYLDVETAFMPLPVQATGSVTEGNGKAPTIMEELSSFAFINANVETKHGEEVAQIAKEFLQFCYSDNELAEFTRNSTVTRDLTYTISDEIYNSLSSFSKSAWDMKKNGKIVNPISAESEYINNPGIFHLYQQNLWLTTYSDWAGLIKAPCKAFKSGSYTVKQYFDSLKKSESWWNGLTR